MSEYKEFWIVPEIGEIKTTKTNTYPSKQFHVIEYAAFEKLQKDWEEAATKNYADKCEIEKLKSNLNNVRNNLIEAESQNNDKCWFNVEIILRQTIDSINEVLK